MFSLVSCIVVSSLFALMSFVLIGFGLANSRALSNYTLSAFDCGFEPFSLSRVTFSLKFFSALLVFLVFDIEVVLVLPLGLDSSALSSLGCSWVALGVFILLLAGLVFEWLAGTLVW